VARRFPYWTMLVFGWVIWLFLLIRIIGDVFGSGARAKAVA
jgi:hypothetical protein